MALAEVMLVNPPRKKKASRRKSAKARKTRGNTMARRKVTRRKKTARRRSPARRKSTTRRRRTTRRKSPSRRRTVKRRKTTRRKSPARRRKTTRRRKSPARRRKTTRRRRSPARRRKTTCRRKTTRRRKPARRRKTTRRRRSPARRRTVRRRSTTRRRPSRRRRTVRSRKSSKGGRRMSLGNAYNWVKNHMTAFEAILATVGGMAAGAYLPALVQNGLSRLGLNASWMTSGQYTPYLSGAAVASLVGFGLYSMKVTNLGTASAIALGGVAFQVFKLANDKGVFDKVRGALGLGYAPVGYLGGGHMGMMDDDPLEGGSFGAAMTYGTYHGDTSMDAMFGGSREMNFY